MRETERVIIMERMREKVRERERRMMQGIKYRFQRERRREGDLIKKMAFVFLNPLNLNIFRLLNSSCVSMDPRSQAFLIFAIHGVNEALQLLKSLEKFGGRIDSKGMEALEEEIRLAALELEDVLDSYVSAQFLSQLSEETERRPLLFSLNLQEIEQDIDSFVQKVMKMEKLLNPWLDDEEEEEEDGDGDVGGKESDIFVLSAKSEVDVTITLLISWLQIDEEEEEEGEEEDDDDGGGLESDIARFFFQAEVELRKVLIFSWLPEVEIGEELDFFKLPFQSEEELRKFLSVLESIDDDDDDEDEEEEEEEEEGGFELSYQPEVDVTRSSFISWFATKAASIFLGKKEEYVQDLEHLLPEEKEGDDYAVLSKSNRTADFSTVVAEDRYRKINDDLMIWWINKAASIFVMETDYTQPLFNPFPEDAVDVAVLSSNTESAVDMVGLTDLFCKIRDDLLEENFKIAIIVGMVGIGKTTLTKKIIEDPLVSRKFECCIFVRVGPEYKWDEILQAIVDQIQNGVKGLKKENVDLDSSMVDNIKYVRKILKFRKCLMVLDDIWAFDFQMIASVFPSKSSQSVILFTTRLNDIAEEVQLSLEGSIYKVPLLNELESWDLLRGKIFGEKGCPYELEKAGKKIAENCEGLPLLIIVVAGLLSLAEKTPEYWSKIAANKTNSIFVEAYEQVSEVVYPSYYYLPQHLKTCFLYLGAFPQNVEFRISKLISLWSADGFLGVSYTFLQRCGPGYLSKIVSNNVAMVTQWNIFHCRHKALSLHSVFWYLCKREAQNEKFLYVLNSYRDATVPGIKSQRRLSIYKNAILSLKDARDSIASISALQSLLCTGAYNQYQVPICLGALRLLKVLDVLTIRFYEFPEEAVKLVHLRYLALTCNGNLPLSISNLWGLQILILHQHQSIRSSVSCPYLPLEIWELQELEHLQIMGRNLPNPPPGAVLRNLLTLLDVGAHSCTDRVLGSIPNLKKLRVRIELLPVAAEPLRFCDDKSHLKRIRSLQLVVVNPELKFEEIVAPAIFISFSYLRKLTLNGFGYPWKDMHNIAKLPFLEELKLKCYAFRGEKWAVKQGEFQWLKYLSIEDTDLVQWTATYLSFQDLEILTIKNCYRLQELPKLSSLRLREIEIVDCNPSAATCAKKLASSDCSVNVESSWLGKGKR